VDGVSAESSLVLKGRLPQQAPDIDPVVYLTDADPGTIAPGDLLDVEIVKAHGYDLVARPLGDPPGRSPDPKKAATGT
jgi:ribosomal protein S12 methylthiotransferase